MSISVGVGLPNLIRDVDPAVIPRWAVAAEQASFASLASYSRYAYPGVSDTVSLAAAAAVTETIGLLSTVLVATAWPPQLLAKEVAGIAGLSGGRLTLGIGVGVRADDFPVAGWGTSARGARLDEDLATMHDIWNGELVGGAQNPIVGLHTPDVPLLFGAMSPPAMARMAKWGRGYIGPGLSVDMAEPLFDGARSAWREAGREGAPYLVGVAYYALADPQGARDYMKDYYSVTPQYVDTVISGIATTPSQIVEVRDRYEAIGADEVIFSPTSADLHELDRLAEALTG